MLNHKSNQTRSKSTYGQSVFLQSRPTTFNSENSVETKYGTVTKVLFDRMVNLNQRNILNFDSLIAEFKSLISIAESLKSTNNISSVLKETVEGQFKAVFFDFIQSGSFGSMVADGNFKSKEALIEAKKYAFVVIESVSKAKDNFNISGYFFCSKGLKKFSSMISADKFYAWNLQTALVEKICIGNAILKFTDLSAKKIDEIYVVVDDKLFEQRAWELSSFFKKSA